MQNKVLNYLLIASLIDLDQYAAAIRLNTAGFKEPEQALTQGESKITYDVIQNVQQDDDEMANQVLEELGFSNGVTNHYLSQHSPAEEAKEEAAAAAAKPAAGADAAKPAAEEAKPENKASDSEDKDKTDGGEDKTKPAAEGEKPAASEGEKPAAEGDKAETAKAPGATKPANQDANQKKKEQKAPEKANASDTKAYEKGTPKEILTDPSYMNAVNRFLPEFNQDPALNEATRNGTIPIDQSDITEEKEREGYYPNDLDAEVQGYTYGDKVSSSGYWQNWWDSNYRSKKYNNIYDPKRRVYNADNKWHPYFGWGFKEPSSKIAPPFDPNSHFQNPYYDYDDSRSQKDYWARMRRGPWGRQPPQPKVEQKGSDEAKKAEAKENGADKLDGGGKEGDAKDGDSKEEKKDGDAKGGDAKEEGKDAKEAKTEEKKEEKKDSLAQSEEDHTTVSSLVQSFGFTSSEFNALNQMTAEKESQQKTTGEDLNIDQLAQSIQNNHLTIKSYKTDPNPAN